MSVLDAPRTSPTKVVVAADLFLDLKLYCTPAWVLDGLHDAFPFLEIIEVNTPRTQGQPLPENAEVYWGNRITRDIIAGLPNLKWIQFGSVGVDRAVVPEVQSRNIIVTNTGDIVAAAMTASALGFILALARGFHHSWDHIHRGIFGRAAFDQHSELIGDIEGQSCLIVGYGHVGQRLAKACGALGMRVFGIRRNKARPTGDVEKFFVLEQLPESVEDKDFIVNLLPLTPQTQNVFSADVFRRMKPTAYFVNVGRGETVDEQALIDALEESRIAGAGLDVFNGFPRSLNSRFLELTNVILTPHVAGLSQAYWPRAYELVKTNIGRYINNMPLLNTRELQCGY